MGSVIIKPLFSCRSLGEKTPSQVCTGLANNCRGGTSVGCTLSGYLGIQEFVFHYFRLFRGPIKHCSEGGIFVRDAEGKENGAFEQDEG